MLVLALSLAVAAQAELPPAEIIERSVQASKAAWKVQAEYDYSVRVEEGKHSKTFDVRMIEGSPYHRLIAVDEEPLSPSQEAEQEDRLRQTIAERRRETLKQREDRIAKWDRARQRNEFLLEQMALAFEFELKGNRQIEGRNVFILSAKPRRGYRPPNNQARVLTGMTGELLIDQQTFQWVKAEAKVIRTVSIAGFLARVDPGTRFELRQAPVAQGIWMPTFFAMKSSARVLFLIPRNTEKQETYFNYRKTSATDLAER